MKRTLVTLLLALPMFCHGQTGIHVLNGNVSIKLQGSYNYQVMFAAKGGKVEGFSITSGIFQGDMKTPIKGTVDVKEHTLKFTEQKNGAQPSIANACYFDVTVTWKEENDKIVFTGTFVGTDAKDQFCDQGTVYLELPKDADPLFAPKKEKQKRLVVKKPAPAPLEQPVANKGTIKITAANTKEFSWRTDSCVLEIWDGGFIDGDIVSVLLNGQRVLSNYTLTADRRRLVLPLRQKTNVLSIVAVNEGEAPPNTSQITLADGANTYSMLSCLKAGETATVTLKKK